MVKRRELLKEFQTDKSMVLVMGKKNTHVSEG